MEGMINVKDKKCYCGEARPSFNYKGLKPLYCFKCKNRCLSNVHISSLTMSFLFFSKPFQWSVFLP